MYCHEFDSSAPPLCPDDLAELGFDQYLVVTEPPCASFIVWNDRERCLVFRGTDNLLDGELDLMAEPVPICVTGGPLLNVHKGLYLWMQRIMPKLEALPVEIGDRPLTLTGHSAGGAVATLIAWLVDNDLLVYTYGSPRVGQQDFVDAYNAKRSDQTMRVVHGIDLVPRLPPTDLGYQHVDRPLILDSDGVVLTAAAWNAHPPTLLQDLDGAALAQHHIDTYVAACSAYGKAIPCAS
jgi:triacylglycerol lipase